MAFSEVFPLSQVVNNHSQVYQIELSNWGNLGTGGPGAPAADANSLAGPEFEISATAIAIDPQSDVTQAIIRPVRNGVLDTSGDLQSDDLVVGKDHPLMGRFSFPRTQPYSGQLATERIIVPTLRMLIYLDANLPIPMVPRRNPFTDQRLTTASVGGPVISQEVFPVAGRKCIRVVGTPMPGAGLNNFELRGITPAQPAGVAGDGLEFDLGSFTLGDANPANFANAGILIEDPCCQFIRVMCDGPSCLYSINAED
ncbi:MAG: hypothetical protein ACYSUI_25530 [Planctomycetota bacterium]|jgi:hypothetical protein